MKRSFTSAVQHTSTISVLPKTEFSIQRLEDLSSSLDHSAPERLEVLEIIMVKHGDGELACDTMNFPLRSMSIYILAPNQVRCLHNTRATGYIIRVAPDFIQQLDGHFDISFIIRLAVIQNKVLSVENMTNLHDMEFLVMKLISEFEQHALKRPAVVRSFVKLVLIRLSLGLKGVNSANTYDRNIDLLRSFFLLLWRQSSSRKLVADYANELCVTPNYLNATVRRLTGFTASHHIQQHIVTEAKRHAIYSVLQMKEIADHLGFEDHAHFSKFFKNYSGMSFSTFRKLGVAI